MNIQLKDVAKLWPEIQPIFSVPHNKKDYNKLVNLLDSLIDEVGNNENHPLTSLMETIGSLINLGKPPALPERLPEFDSSRNISKPPLVNRSKFIKGGLQWKISKV